MNSNTAASEHASSAGLLKRTLCAGLLSLLLIGSSHASYDDFTDYGWYAYEGTSGLYWLDITETVNLTWLDVYYELEPGGRYQGWRFATKAEIEAMWQNIGIEPQGNSCIYTGALYCDYWANTTDRRLAAGRLIDLLGNTLDPYWQRSYDYDTGEFPRGFFGMMEEDDVYTADPDTFVNRGYVIEHGHSREIKSAGRDSTDDYHYGWGSFLVRTTPPTPLPPRPDTTPPGAVDFDTLGLTDLGLQPACVGSVGGTPYSRDPFYAYCSGHMMSVGADGTARIKIGLPADFDRQATPFLRLSGFDFRDFDIYDNQAVCIPGGIQRGKLYIEDAQGKHYFNGATFAPAPQGGDWCRVSFDTEYQFLPLLPADDEFPGIATAVTIGVEERSANYNHSTGFDNLILELVGPNMVIDFDPWSEANTLRPDFDSIFAVEIKSTSVADGDAFDFDATTVDASTLVAGPAAAPNVVAVDLSFDYDEDGDIDRRFAFRILDSGLTCIDRSVTVSGKDLDGNPLVGIDVIVPIQCDETATVDVDPFNSANEIRPNDSYTVPVAILSTQKANGEPGDIDATQVNPATLAFGPNQAPNSQTPVVTDIDGDSDADVIFGFNAYNAGIACGDTELEVTGDLFNTQPFVGTDSISTVECDTGGCHP